MSWLSDRTGVHWNLRPYAAAAGGILGGMVGGPLGAGIGAGLFKTADNKAHGDSWTHALEQGALNGGLAYGAGALGNHFSGAAHGAPMPGVQFTPSSVEGIQGPGGAVLNMGTSSPVQQSVMSRVMGGAGSAARGAGSFIKDNRGTLETLGSTAEGIGNMNSQNRQNAIQQQLADAQTAQSNAAIDKQHGIQAAFAKMYGMPLTSQPGAPRSISAPGGPSYAVVDGEQDPGFSGGPKEQTPPHGISSGPSSTPSPATLSVLSRLGYMPPPGSDDYTSLSSLYGMSGMGGY